MSSRARISSPWRRRFSRSSSVTETAPCPGRPALRFAPSGRCPPLDSLERACGRRPLRSRRARRRDGERSRTRPSSRHSLAGSGPLAVVCLPSSFWLWPLPTSSLRGHASRRIAALLSTAEGHRPSRTLDFALRGTIVACGRGLGGEVGCSERALEFLCSPIARPTHSSGAATSPAAAPGPPACPSARRCRPAPVGRRPHTAPPRTVSHASRAASPHHPARSPR